MLSLKGHNFVAQCSGTKISDTYLTYDNGMLTKTGADYDESARKFAEPASRNVDESNVPPRLSCKASRQLPWTEGLTPTRCASTVV